MTSSQLLIYALVAGGSCIAGILIPTWIYYRRSKTIEQFNRNMIADFWQIGNEFDTFTPDLEADFYRISTRLDGTTDRFEHINKKLESFENIIKQAEFAKDDEVLRIVESWWDTPDASKRFKITQN